MAAKDNSKKATIVIKKITVVAGGGHGGSWKVAFADFMTAMMAFFLVMWLVNQSEEVKKSVSDYFSTPSIIEYNFSNYGVELTLEKLFLDLLNEPLKALEQFIVPADKKPNVLDMGHKKIQTYYLTEKVGEFAKNLQITSDEIIFDIPEDYLFTKLSSTPTKSFVDIMENVRGIIDGLSDANVYINSELPYRGQESEKYKNVAEARLDLVIGKVEVGLKDPTVDLYGKTTVEKITAAEGKRDERGYVKFRIVQKANPGGVKETKKEKSSRKPSAEESEVSKEIDSRAKVYDNFVDDLTKQVESNSGRDKTNSSE